MRGTSSYDGPSPPPAHTSFLETTPDTRKLRVSLSLERLPARAVEVQHQHLAHAIADDPHVIVREGGNVRELRFSAGEGAGPATPVPVGDLSISPGGGTEFAPTTHTSLGESAATASVAPTAAGSVTRVQRCPFQCKTRCLWEGRAKPTAQASWSEVAATPVSSPLMFGPGETDQRTPFQRSISGVAEAIRSPLFPPRSTTPPTVQASRGETATTAFRVPCFTCGLGVVRQTGVHAEPITGPFALRRSAWVGPEATATPARAIKPIKSQPSVKALKAVPRRDRAHPGQRAPEP